MYLMEGLSVLKTGTPYWTIFRDNEKSITEVANHLTEEKSDHQIGDGGALSCVKALLYSNLYTPQLNTRVEGILPNSFQGDRNMLPVEIMRHIPGLTFGYDALLQALLWTPGLKLTVDGQTVSVKTLSFADKLLHLHEIYQQNQATLPAKQYQFWGSFAHATEANVLWLQEMMGVDTESDLYKFHEGDYEIAIPSLDANGRLDVQHLIKISVNRDILAAIYTRIQAGEFGQLQLASSSEAFTTAFSALIYELWVNRPHNINEFVEQNNPTSIQTNKEKKDKVQVIYQELIAHFPELTLSNDGRDNILISGNFYLIGPQIMQLLMLYYPNVGL